MDKHNSCINSKAIVEYVKEKAPSRLDMLFDGLGEEAEGINDPETFFCDSNNWISSSLLIKLFENARDILGEKDVAYNVGFNSILKQRLGYIQRILLYAFGSPAKLVKEVQRINDHFNRTKQVEILKASKREAVVRLLWAKDIPLTRDFCLMNKGIYQAIPMIWGLPPGGLIETKCYFNGDEYCEYHLYWDEASPLKNLLQKIFLPWKVARDTIHELEKDKEALKEKYNQVHLLNLELQQKIKQLTTLQECSTAILSTLKLEELLDLILHKLLHIAHLDRAGIFLTDHERQTLTLIHAVGLEEGAFEELKGYKIPLSKSDNIIARTARLNKAVIVEDVSKMSLNPQNPILKRLKPKAFILVPLTVKGRTIGIMVGDNYTDRDFLRGVDKGFLTSFANHIAMALENATLYEKLKESERRYRDIVQNVNEGIWLLDANGTIEFSNRCLQEMFDCDLKGKNIYDLADEEERKKLLHVLMENISGRPAKDEIVLMRGDGQDIHVLLSSVPLKKEGLFRGALSILTDLTEKKRMEDRLLQAQKLESVGTMAGGIAHDFNNILTGILGYVMLMKQKPMEQEDLMRCLDVVERSGLRAADLVKKLLAFSRGTQPGKVQPTDPGTVLHDAIELLKTSIPKNITVTTSISAELPAIHCNPTQLQQAVLNICLNAKDAMPEGGLLTITTRIVSASELSKRYGFSSDRGYARFVEIDIADTGTGISQEDMDRIFDPFFTTKGVGKGSGLGLAMVYGIVKASKGFIHVDSEIGKGTCFRLFFPAGEAQVEPQETREGTRDHSGSETILVVDDEEIVRDLAKEVLSSHGYTVMTARDGLEALHIYEALGRRIDLVILDVIMPGMNGQETYKKLKGINPDIKVLFCSGHGMDQETVNEVMERGLPFTGKPFDLDELMEQVRRVLDA